VALPFQSDAIIFLIIAIIQHQDISSDYKHPDWEEQRDINPVSTQIVGHIVLAQVIFRQSIQVESLHRAAVAAELSITGIIQHNEKHIRRTFLGAVGFRPGRFGSLIRAANPLLKALPGLYYLRGIKISPYLDILGLAVL
jgi:hypothetical protein